MAQAGAEKSRKLIGYKVRSGAIGEYPPEAYDRLFDHRPLGVRLWKRHVILASRLARSMRVSVRTPIPVRVPCPFSKPRAMSSKIRKQRPRTLISRNTVTLTQGSL